EVEVEVDGEDHRPAEKPTLIATGEPVQSVVEQGKAGDRPDDPTAEVIVSPVVDKASAYVGEHLVYERQNGERTNGTLNVPLTPTFKDFWSENLLPEDRSRRRPPVSGLTAGVPYSIHQTLSRALFPQKAGTATIGGPEI